MNGYSSHNPLAKPSVSIVINTYNRANTLRVTLRSLAYQRYRNFEVIVVNGPSTDDTEKVLAEFSEAIRVGTCSVRNLSVSRNIGIAMASGEIVAFIDDDAIPEPEWLGQIVAGYNSEEVAGVGGFVYDHTGVSFQSQYLVCDRVGGVRFDLTQNPTNIFCFPCSKEYPSLLGTNASYRRDLLLKIGGFDEYFAYYLDETDVCLRLIDMGYRIKFVDGGYVHHKFAPSHVRNEARVAKDYSLIAKSKGYFAFRNGLAVLEISEIYKLLSEWRDWLFHTLTWQRDHGQITAEDRLRLLREIEEGLEEGMKTALREPNRALLNSETVEELQGSFVPFPTIPERDVSPLSVVILSQTYPSQTSLSRPYGGIGKWSWEAAREMAKLGHNVYIITLGNERPTVDFEDCVWVHRIVPESNCGSKLKIQLNLPDRIADYSTAVHNEILKIKGHRTIDFVISPLWDHEGIATFHSGEVPVVFWLQTTFQLMKNSHPDSSNQTSTEENVAERLYIEQMIEAERLILNGAPLLLCNSLSFLESLESSYNLQIPRSKVQIITHGISDHRITGSEEAQNKAESDELLKILFVGRLEARKGIDLLLQVIPDLCHEFPSIKFQIAGDEVLDNKTGYMTPFFESYPELANRVSYLGRVSDNELLQLYADCDIFVAPSRFESFGLIYVEAMVFSKPVIGTRTGGTTEIITHDVNGLLIEPEDTSALAGALRELIENRGKREALGKNGRRIYEEKYSSKQMVENLLAGVTKRLWQVHQSSSSRNSLRATEFTQGL